MVDIQDLQKVGRSTDWVGSYALQVETGSAITWKYPSVILKGDNSVGEFYSVALTNNFQQADTGSKMVHVGKNTRSRIVSKGISAGQSRNCYRGLVQIMPSAEGARNNSQCDSMLLGDRAQANTYPYIQVCWPLTTLHNWCKIYASKCEKMLAGFYVQAPLLMVIGSICFLMCADMPFHMMQ